MNRRCSMLISCLLLLSITVGCAAATPRPTATPPPTATPVPTPTPVPAPSATPIPGWKQFAGGGVTLWLPETWVGGGLPEGLDAVLEQLRLYGATSEQIEQARQSLAEFDIVALAPGPTPSGGVVVAQIGQHWALSAEAYLDEVAKEFAGRNLRNYRVVEKGTLSLGPYAAGRVVIEYERAQGTRFYDLRYGIQHGSRVWEVIYTCYDCAADEPVQWFPIFEQSSRTFRVTP